MKYRICYSKKDVARYISHLDFQRAFQRALRRTSLNVTYSEGFNPHQVMSYSPPLPLFVESDAEYADISLDSELSAEIVYKEMSEVMPRGLNINSVTPLKEKHEALSKTFSSASWQCTLEGNSDKDAQCAQAAVQKVFASTSAFLIEKKNKKKQIVQKDIRPLVISLSAKAQGADLVIDSELAVREGAVLNPYELLNALRANTPELKEFRVKKVYKSAMN